MRQVLIQGGNAVVTEVPAPTVGKWNILVSVELLAERPLDEEAALMIARELWHVALEHRRRPDAGKRN